MAIPNAEVTSPEVADWSMDQPTTRRLNTSRTTAQYTYPSWVGVFCDIGHPQAIGLVTHEVAVYQVRWRIQGFDPPSAASARAQAGQAGSSHEHRHRIVAHCHPIAEPQFGMHPQGAVGSAGLLADAGG